MGEAFDSNPGSLDRLAYEEYPSTLNVKLRWAAYNHCELKEPDGVTPFSIHNEVIRQLELTGKESIVDVGCADGDVLLRLLEAGHQGEMMGIDINRDFFSPSLLALKDKEDSRLIFSERNAQNLGLAPDSVDVLLACFMLYHLPNPEAALNEFKKVVKPGGKIVIATSDSRENKLYHRIFERKLAQRLGATSPQPFAARFDTHEAEQILPRLFTNIHVVDHYDHMLIGPPGSQSYDDYLGSLDSMFPSFKRDHPISYMDEWKPAIEELVQPTIMYFVDKNGIFRDLIRRRAYICTNNKLSLVPSS